jgi:uncharacterized membrane protein (GlpM family)
MSFLEGFMRFFLGGILVLAVSLFARYGKSSIAGVAALFPAVTVASFYFMSKMENIEKKSILEAIKTGAIAMPTVLIFLIVLYFAYQRFDMVKSLLLGMVGWLITAVIIITIKNSI